MCVMSWYKLSRVERHISFSRWNTWYGFLSLQVAANQDQMVEEIAKAPKGPRLEVHMEWVVV